MTVEELKVDISLKPNQVEIVGRREILAKAIDGAWATTFKGRGMEFTGYRQYTYSDDASMIDWKASLRSKELLVREFEEYRNFNIVFMLDVSNSMLFTTGEKFKAEYAAEMVFSLSQAASRVGDAVGLAMFSDKIVAKLDPSYGHGMAGRFQRLLGDRFNYGGEKDYKKSLLQLDSMLGERSIIIIVSDFLGMNADWETFMQYLAHKHELIGIMVKDVRDRELPKTGQYVVKDPNSTQTIYMDAAQYAKAYIDASLRHEEQVRNVFRRMKSDCTLIINESDYVGSLEKFFNSHRRVNQ